jgi:hypothetical protein
MSATGAMFERLEALRYRRIVKADRHDPAQFDLLAEATGHPVPADYLEFLRRFPDSGRFEIEGGVHLATAEGRRVGVAILYAGSSIDDCDLFELRQEQQDEDGAFLPLRWLPIGEDGDGDLFGLDLAAEGAGGVWHAGDAQGEAGLVLVAHSFAAFIGALRGEG